MSCRFYKELDAILGSDPTSTAKTTVDTLAACMPVESGPSQEEEILDEDVEGMGEPEAANDSEVRNVCSQELFSTPEEASQSQLSELGEAEIGEKAPAEWLHRIRKWPRRTKEDFLHDVMMHSTAEKQELKEWQDSEKKDRKENTACQNEAMEWLLKVMERQADTLQVILALQTEQLHAHPPLQPLSRKSFDCTPQTLPTQYYQPPHSSLYPQHSTPPSITVDSHYPLYSTPIPLQFGPAKVHYPLHCSPRRRTLQQQKQYVNSRNLDNSKHAVSTARKTRGLHRKIVRDSLKDVHLPLDRCTKPMLAYGLQHLQGKRSI
ncbi:hypothetical protein UY3_12523 [Chelonia mydas]|uniref:Uncharacterized protein n=1 Tax=Chelonia mydas TaxID=8469 RepID=M7AXX4_CHEMY|nr:hypothetical protein UY3_12523 [Chelonia mydas]